MFHKTAWNLLSVQKHQNEGCSILSFNNLWANSADAK